MLEGFRAEDSVTPKTHFTAHVSMMLGMRSSPETACERTAWAENKTADAKNAVRG